MLVVPLAAPFPLGPLVALSGGCSLGAGREGVGTPAKCGHLSWETRPLEGNQTASQTVD